MADDAMSRVRWKAVASNLMHAFVGGRYAGNIVRYQNDMWRGYAQRGDRSVVLNNYRRRCDAKRAVELALSGGAAPMPGYVHPRSDHGFGPPWLMNAHGASIFRRHLRKEKRKARCERRRGAR